VVTVVLMRLPKKPLAVPENRAINKEKYPILSSHLILIALIIAYNIDFCNALCYNKDIIFYHRRNS
jgi:hypothetical protein